jgi:hypothetical protein
MRAAGTGVCARAQRILQCVRNNPASQLHLPNCERYHEIRLSLTGPAPASGSENNTATASGRSSEIGLE